MVYNIIDKINYSFLVSDNEDSNDDQSDDVTEFIKGIDYAAEDFKINDSEESKLFRKFLISWEKHFNRPTAQQQSTASKKPESILNIVNVAKKKQSQK